ncbi:MAG: DUF1549 domain-containing protein [Planctomycetes bacterium]|nr:DUF1549 domain-containing protein [Planctomycetota bacterium]
MRSSALVVPLLAIGWLQAQSGPDTDWAFRPMRTVAVPTVANAEWNGGAIDRVVYARLQQAGITPNPRADRRTLLRRASFVLTGLPPTPAELDAFVADPSPDAFAEVVDRLLASVHHAEHQARHWLDLARYSDSNGLDENLAFANGGRYRDWVVQAHATDLPFDRFVRMQIAGDLLADDPAVGLDGHVATGFLALGPRMLAEQDKEKLVLDTVDEQIDLVGRTFLGLTLGCARCHDHKFDPISQRDYYALAGIFRSTKSFRELGHVSQWFDRELATDAAIAARKAAETARDATQADLQQATTRALDALRHELVAHTGNYLLAGGELLAQGTFLQAEAATATNLHADDRHWGSAECVVLHTHQGGPQFAEWRVQVATGGRQHLMVRCASAESRPMRVSIDGAVAIAETLGVETGGWMPVNQQWHDAGTFELAAGEHVLRLDGLAASIPHLDALLLTPVQPVADVGLVPPVVRQFAAVLGAMDRHPLVAFWHEATRGAADGFAARTAALQGKGGLAALLLGGLPPASPRELAARYQTLFASAAAAAGAATAARKDKSKDDKKPVRLDEPSLEQARALLFDHGGLLAFADAQLRPFLPAATLAELDTLQRDLDGKRAAVPERAPTAMCVVDDAVRDLPVHLRGNHLTLAADAVPRGVPAVFASLGGTPALPKNRSGRAEFAAWLCAPEQPLAARVQANRIWQRAFGHGLVRSPSNFGRRGDLPVHGDLLDLLAADFRADGWSQKRLWRRILLSRTWQQTSDCSEAQLQKDPENRLLGRQHRNRIPAEAIRDAMLAIAGDLDRTVGGSLLKTGDRGYVTNDQSNDGARYDAKRRSLYLPIIRNAMFDLFEAFDYADPSVHLEQRAQTSVAPQALWLLNAPFVAEQGKGLAARALALAGDAERIDFLWRECFVRVPSPAERAAASAWLATARANGDDAGAFAGLAAALFATNEFVHVD